MGWQDDYDNSIADTALECAAKAIDARCAFILGKQTEPAKTAMEESINLNLRLTAVMLPDLASEIRAMKSREGRDADTSQTSG